MQDKQVSLTNPDEQASLARMQRVIDQLEDVWKAALRSIKRYFESTTYLLARLVS